MSEVNRFLAAILLLVWTASVGRCLAEQYGLLHKMPGLECCEHQHDHDQPAPQPQPSGDPCGICTMIDHSGVSLAKPVLLATPLLVPMVDIAVPEALDAMLERAQGALEEVLLRPPEGLQWGAYLVKTSLPVRGPNLA